MTQQLVEEWFEPYHTGKMVARNAKGEEMSEEWAYERGKVTCTYGRWKELGHFSFDGADIAPTLPGSAVGRGVFDGNAIHWVFPEEAAPWLNGRAFYSCKLTDKQTSSFTWTMSQIKWRKPTHWRDDREARRIELNGGGEDAPEGLPTQFDVLGEVPPPVALAIAMFGRAQKLLEDWRERRNRSFKRCKKLCLKLIAQPYLCEICASEPDVCIVCGGDGAAHSAMMCKQCSIRKFTCVKCGEKCGSSRVEGKLCDDCGLGSRSNDCARMLKQ